MRLKRENGLRWVQGMWTSWGCSQAFLVTCSGLRVWIEAGHVDLGALSMGVIVKIGRRPELAREERRGMHQRGRRLVCGNMSVCKEDKAGARYVLRGDTWVK